MTESPIFDPNCQRCPRLVRFLEDVQERHPEYFCAPVPSFGDAWPQLLIVGLAPGMHGANRTGRPFTGDHAGVLLYRLLYELGKASSPHSLDAADGLCLHGVRITNAVKCLPPQNKPTTPEIACCNTYLRSEIRRLPDGCHLLALGRVAHDAVLRAYGLRLRQYHFQHAAVHEMPDGRRLYDSYHCSRYNTQTGRLTEAMFRAVLAAACDGG